MKKILDFYIRKFNSDNSDKCNGVEINYNMFDTIISELDDYGIIPVRIREGYGTGRGHNMK